MIRTFLPIYLCAVLAGCGGPPRDPQMAAWEARERQTGRLIGEVFTSTQWDGKIKHLALVRTKDGIARGTGELDVVSGPDGWNADWPENGDLKNIPAGHFIHDFRSLPNRPDAGSQSHHYDTVPFLFRPEGELRLPENPKNIEGKGGLPGPFRLDAGRTLYAGVKDRIWSAVMIDRSGSVLLRAEMPVSGPSELCSFGSLLVLSTPTFGNTIIDPRTLQPIQGPPLILVTRYGKLKLLAVRDGKGVSALIGPYGPVSVALPGRLIPYYIDETQKERDGRASTHDWAVTHWFVEAEGQRTGVLDADGNVLRRDLRAAEVVDITGFIKAAGDYSSHQGIMLHAADDTWRVMWSKGDMPDSDSTATRDQALGEAIRQRSAYNVARINAHNQAALAQIHANLTQAALVQQRRAEESAQRARLAALGPEYRKRFDEIRSFVAKGPLWIGLQRIEAIDRVIAHGADPVAWDQLRRDAAQAVLDQRDGLGLRTAQGLVSAIQAERNPATALAQAELVALANRLASLELELSNARFATPSAGAANFYNADAERARNAEDVRHRTFIIQTQRIIDDLRRSTR